MWKRLCLALLGLAAMSLVLSAAAVPRLPNPNIYGAMAMLGLKQQGETVTYLDNSFAPLGWSRDGKFAYVETVTDEAVGYGGIALLRWVIFDAVRDKTLWDSGNEFENPPEHLSGGLAGLMQWEWGHFASYRAQFARYKIVLQPGLALGRFPFTHQGVKCGAAIINPIRGEAYGFPDMLLGFDLRVAKDRAAKNVASYKNDCLLDAGVGGFVKSPFEPRIAVVLGTVSRGWEGPPHPVEFRMAGCHLEKGFAP